MKIIILIGVVLVSLFADFLALSSNFNFWNSQDVYLDYPLLALGIIIVCNYLLLKLSARTVWFQKKLFSFVVILINAAFIFTFLTSIDGSSIHLFGRNLISSSGITIVPYLFFPKYLFIFPLLIAIVFGFLNSSQKRKGLSFYPYLALCIFSIFVFLMYLLNLNFFYNLFRLAGVASHVYNFGIYFLLELIVSLIIAHLVSKSSSLANN